MPPRPDPGFPYHRIVDDLRSEILSGNLAPGSRIHSEWSLASKYDTSRPTVRRALAVLKSEGLVVTRQGQGSFVRSLPPVHLSMGGMHLRGDRRRSGRPGLIEQLEEQGHHPELVLDAVSVVKAPDYVAERLDIEPHADVVLRGELLVVNGDLMGTSDRYFPLAIAEGTAIAEAQPVPGGILALIEDPDGPIRRTMERSVDEITSRLPTEREAAKLGIPRSLPVSRLLRTGYDTTGTAIEVREALGVADRYEFRYEANFR
ncbi:GntR family transcriptional regulator [Pseudonocardia spinosispora]|uniref:GntR family transcriptional regulator n=1 Tax=Pseudonocardia spinosispora TaxID=103441 RepID=UPI0003FF041B|nr:GntR family transcriptional regulator [Pseudonocardia spinosispora]